MKIHHSSRETEIESYDNFILFFSPVMYGVFLQLHFN